MLKARVLTAVLALLTSASLISPVAAQGRSCRDDRTARQRKDNQYERAFDVGYTDGARDARQGRAYDPDHDVRRLRGTGAFRRGYAEGYRAGFQSFRAELRNAPRVAPYGYGASRGGYQDPAFSRGLSEGYKRGFEDGRDRDRYDPVRHGEYRDGDNGYFGGCGARDAFRDNS